MSRRVIPLVALVLLTSLSAAPVPKAVKVENPLFPYPVGTKWEYANPKAPDKVTETSEVVRREEKDGATCVTIKSTWDTRVLRIDAEGVKALSVGNHVFEKPKLIRKAELKEGDTWVCEVDGGYSETRTIGKKELVTVPAGEFLATRIEWKCVENGKLFRNGTLWTVPGVGTVKAYEEGHTDDVLSVFTLGRGEGKK